MNNALVLSALAKNLGENIYVSSQLLIISAEKFVGARGRSLVLCWCVCYCYNAERGKKAEQRVGFVFPIVRAMS